MTRRKTHRVVLDDVRTIPAETRAPEPPRDLPVHAPLRCIVCQVPVHDYGPWTAFSLANRPILYACARHAPLVQRAITGAAQLATSGIKHLFDSRYPGLLDKVRETTALTAELLHLWWPSSSTSGERN